MYNHWNIYLLDVLSRIASKQIADPYCGRPVFLDLGVITNDDSFVLDRRTVTLTKSGITGHNIIGSFDVTIAYKDIIGLDAIYIDIDVDYDGYSVDCIPYMEYRRCCDKPLKFNMLRPKYKEIKL